jgi:hypothetical protein
MQEELSKNLAFPDDKSECDSQEDRGAALHKGIDSGRRDETSRQLIGRQASQSPAVSAEE